MSESALRWLAFALRTAGTGAPALPGDGDVINSATWTEQEFAGPAPAGGTLLLCDTAAPLRLPGDGPDWTWTGVQLGAGGVIAPAGAGGLLLNLMDIDAAHADEFNDWYDTEHLPRMAAVEGVILARRFRSEADTPRYLASYHLRDLSVLAGEAWKEAASTPWTARMRRHRTGLVRKGFVPV